MLFPSSEALDGIPFVQIPVSQSTLQKFKMCGPAFQVRDIQCQINLRNNGWNKASLLIEKLSELYISKVQGESLKECALDNISHTDFCTEAFSYSVLITLIIRVT